jgi:hypothetical protein
MSPELGRRRRRSAEDTRADHGEGRQGRVSVGVKPQRGAGAAPAGNMYHVPVFPVFPFFDAHVFRRFLVVYQIAGLGQ